MFQHMSIGHKEVGFRLIRSTPCDVEVMARDGRIDDELGLYGINIPLEKAQTAMMLDNTNIKCCCPGSGQFGDYVGAPRRPGAHYYQKSFYSGYFRGHSLKFQHMLLPNGLNDSVWGTSQTYNDTSIMNMIGLVEYLCDILEPTPPGDLPCALGAGISPQSGVLATTKPHGGASRDDICLMAQLTSIRQPVELQYCIFFNKQTIFRHQEPFKLFRH